MGAVRQDSEQDGHCAIVGGADACVRQVATVRTVDLSRHIGAAKSSGHCNLIKVELDSHADTCVVGKNALVFHKHDRHVMVSGYDPSLPGRKAEIVDAAVLYVTADTFEPVILLIHQAIYIPELEHCLLCPMQCRMNGVEISETPKFLVKNPTALDHSIRIFQPEDQAHPLNIPLQLDGVVSYFSIRCPTVGEFEDDRIPQIELTAAGAEWDPTMMTLPAWRAAPSIIGVKLLAL